ncbi:1-acyl-sn-glycerol-3-phosphate acyltransferase, partial [Acidithiobacillus ferrooxidans]|nr:1-acyl-sn-glycerol-3-phosphate acyltransferase [Acidithiobacillus ferrooxidans]
YRIHLGQRFDPPTDVRVFTAELESYFQSALVDAKLPHLPAVTDVHSS